MSFSLADYKKTEARAFEYLDVRAIPLLLITAAGVEPQMATGSLIDIDGSAWLVTAGHVLAEFRSRGKNAALQVGRTPNVIIRGNDSRPCSFSEKPDVGAIAIHRDEVEGVGSQIISTDEVVAKPVRRFELVAFLGFPGAGKVIVGNRQLSLTRAERLATVTTVEPDQFSIRLNPATHEMEGSTEAQRTSDELGGISGAPVISLITGWPHLTTRRRPAVVGWVSEGATWGQFEEKIYVTPGGALRTLKLVGHRL